MSSKGSVSRLIEQLGSSDPQARQQAAHGIWKRYFPELLELARRNLHARIRRREDEEDVLQTMYKSICLRIQRGLFTLENRDDLWRLLVTVTLNKTKTAAKRHTRGMRNVNREDAAGQNDDAPNWVFDAMEASQPGPQEAVALTEEFEARLDSLPPELRQLALWKLEGYTHKEIAAPDKMNCTERTVERKLNLIRKKWEGGG